MNKERSKSNKEYKADLDYCKKFLSARDIFKGLVDYIEARIENKRVY